MKKKNNTTKAVRFVKKTTCHQDLAFVKSEVFSLGFLKSKNRIKHFVIWFSNIFTLSVPDEGFFQKRFVLTIFDMFLLILPVHLTHNSFLLQRFIGSCINIVPEIMI